MVEVVPDEPSSVASDAESPPLSSPLESESSVLFELFELFEPSELELLLLESQCERGPGGQRRKSMKSIG